MSDLTQKFNEVFLIKYKPKTLDEAKYPKRIVDIVLAELENFNTNPEFQMQLLLHGTAGTGKTTLSNILRLMSGAETKILSGSNDFNIETLRQKVVPFISTHSNIFGKRKLLIIDECERIKPLIQDALKTELDKTRCGVIFITNHFYDVINPIQSRCTCIDFNYTGDEKIEQTRNFIQLIVKVTKENGMSIDPDGLKALTNRYFPDFRQTMKILQQFYDTKTPINKETVENLIIDGVSDVELYESLKIIDDGAFFTKVSEWKGREYDTFISLCNPFFIWLNSQGLHRKTIDSAIVVGKWGNQLNNSPNKWVALFACLCELRSIYLK